MQAAKLACYAWRKWQKATILHPIMEAIAGTALGEFWYFGLDRTTNEAGERELHARIYERSNPCSPADPMADKVPSHSHLPLPAGYARQARSDPERGRLIMFNRVRNILNYARHAVASARIRSHGPQGLL